MPRAATAMAVAAAALVMLGAAASPAGAHAFLVRTDPAQGARLDRPAAEVALQFSEPVEPAGVVIGARSAAGDEVAIGEPQLGSGGQVVRVPLLDADDGVVVISWQVVSAVDGHESVGEFAFAAGDVEGTEGLLDGAAAEDEDGGGSLWAAGGRLLRLAGLTLAAGGLVTLRFLPTPADQRRLLATLASAGLVAAAVGAAWPLMEAETVAAATGQAGTPAGEVMTAGVSVLLLATALLLTRLVGARVAALGVLGVVAALWSFRSHATAYAGWVGGLVDFVHGAAAAVWVGSLVAAVAVLWRSRRSDPAAVRRLLVGYARLAVWLVVVVVGTGAYSATRLLTEPADLVATPYGRLLLAKLALVAVAVTLALVGRLRGLLRARSRLLRRITAGEAAVLAVVLAVTAVLAGVGPPAGRTEAASLLGPPPFDGPVARTAGLAGALTVYATAGDGLLLVELRSPSGGIADIDAQIAAALPDGRQVDLEPRPCGDGCLVQRLALPEGTTELEVHADAPGWAAGWFTGTLAWPPEPEDPALLADLVDRMRDVQALELVEQVSSGPQSRGGESRAQVSGEQFLELVPYGGGDADEIRPLPDEPDAFTFYLPGSRIHVTVWLDAEGRVDRQRIVSPGHEIDHRITYPRRRWRPAMTVRGLGRLALAAAILWLASAGEHHRPRRHVPRRCPRLATSRWVAPPARCWSASPCGPPSPARRLSSCTSSRPGAPRRLPTCPSTSPSASRPWRCSGAGRRVAAAR